MTITFNIEEPGENASEIAVETRNILAAKIKAWEEQCNGPALQDMTADRRTELKNEGKVEFQQVIATLRPLSVGMPEQAFLLKAYTRAVFLLHGLDDSSSEAQVRDFTYRMEGVANAYSRAIRASGAEVSADDERMRVLAMLAPAATTSRQDDEVKAYFHTDSMTYFTGSLYSLMQRGENGLHDIVTHWNVEDAAQWFPSTPGYYAAPVVYFEADGPWVAGYLNPASMGKMRFTRQRFGAWLKASGYLSDEKIKRRVEQQARTVATARFVFIPNDKCWSGTYRLADDGVGSCMTHDTDSYNTWDDIHPVDVYSSAWFGKGDNGLVLVTATDADGETIGRGIMNVNHDSDAVVRWYGSNTACRALGKLGFDASDYYCLKGSWLALVTGNDDSDDKAGLKFIHPYVDGSVYKGRIDEAEGRVYLQSTGGRDLQMTEGSSFSQEVRWCCDLQAYRPADQAMPRAVQGGWQSLNPSWLCPVLHESCAPSDRHELVLDGKMVQVCEDVYYRKSQYLSTVDATDALVEEFGCMAQFYTRNRTWTGRHETWLASQPEAVQQQLALPIPASPSSSPVSSDPVVLTAAQESSLRRRPSEQASWTADTRLSPTDQETYLLWLERYAPQEVNAERILMEAQAARARPCGCMSCQHYLSQRPSMLEAAFGRTVTGRLTRGVPAEPLLRRPSRTQPAADMMQWVMSDFSPLEERVAAAYFPEITRAASSLPTLIPSTGSTASSSSTLSTAPASLLPMTSTADGPQS